MMMMIIILYNAIQNRVNRTQPKFNDFNGIIVSPL